MSVLSGIPRTYEIDEPKDAIHVNGSDRDDKFDFMTILSVVCRVDAGGGYRTPVTIAHMIVMVYI